MSRMADAGTNPSELVIHVDGRQSLSAELVAAIGATCDRAELRGGPGQVIVYVSGAPPGPLATGLTVGLISKWERALRRLERLPVATTGVAVGDCGGLALDALLATDYRVADPSVRLLMPVRDGATWPGMALYRLTQQAGALRRTMLFGAPIEAAEALTLHLIDSVTDDPAAALSVAARLTGAVTGPELAIRRQLISDAASTTFEDALGAHLAACDRVIRRGTTRAAS